jgi:hypothetical protein
MRVMPTAAGTQHAAVATILPQFSAAGKRHLVKARLDNSSRMQAES